MNVRYLLGGVLALLTAPFVAGAGDRLTMRVSPTVAFAPAYLVVRTQVEANARNRSIEIIAESGDFYRSSEIQLDGEKAPRTTRFEFRGLPGGLYTVAAVLKGADSEPLALTRQNVNVVESLLSR
ncbi:MAG: hypothetical protein ABJA98_35990 [Acidobacteriota bacterium]